MAILNKFEKQPAEIKDYDIDYSQWLLHDGDQLDEVVANVECLTSDDDTLLVSSVDMTTMGAKLWLRGGTDGEKYKVTLRAGTVGGRLDESELIFKVKDR